MLSSRVHSLWALASGGRLGVRHDPRYNKTRCFEPFPFPIASAASRARIAELAEQLDAHRKRQQAAHPKLTLTKLYKALDMVVRGEALTPKDAEVWHEGLGSTLRSIHDDIDAVVLGAYGWPQDIGESDLLNRLVALNKERADEEKRGKIRWLRPDFQNPSGDGSQTMTQVTLTDDESAEDAPAAAVPSAMPWPKKMAAQIQAVRDHVTRSSDEVGVGDVVREFKGAKAKDVEEVLESLTALGLLVSYELVEGKRWRSTRFTKSASVPPPNAEGVGGRAGAI